MKGAGYYNSIKNILSDLGCYSPEISFEVYQQYPSTFSAEQYENQSTTPVWFETDKYSPDKPKVPAQYSKKPASTGNDFQRIEWGEF